jgi:hypothetical protein
VRLGHSSHRRLDSILSTLSLRKRVPARQEACRSGYTLASVSPETE